MARLYAWMLAVLCSINIQMCQGWAPAVHSFIAEGSSAQAFRLRGAQHQGVTMVVTMKRGRPTSHRFSMGPHKRGVSPESPTPIPALEATLSSGRYDYMAAKTAILAIFETDPATAVRMLALFPEHSRGDSISTRNDCISLLQGMSPQGALTFIMDMDAKYRNDRQTAQHVGPFGETWVKSDPTAAMNWALSQPSCFTRQQILAQMVKTWGETDAVSARSFLSEVPRNTLPNGPLRDRLMAEISKGEDSNEGKTER